MNLPAPVAPDSTDLGQNPNKPAQFAESIVNACTATACRYNKALTCGAGAVTVTIINGKPTCATFSPAIAS